MAASAGSAVREYSMSAATAAALVEKQTCLQFLQLHGFLPASPLALTTVGSANTEIQQDKHLAIDVLREGR